MYREQGYLPDAFRNYLALLGWSPGDEEILPIETILERFCLEDVQRSPAFFDVKKLNHINGVYIRALSTEGFILAARPWVDPVPGAWSPGGWRRSGHGGTGHAHRRPGNPAASTQPRLPAWPRPSRSG